jgi:hypothetical protein
MTQPGQSEAPLSMASEEMDNGGQMRMRRGVDSKGGSQLCFTECEC